MIRFRNFNSHSNMFSMNFSKLNFQILINYGMHFEVLKCSVKVYLIFILIIIGSIKYFFAWWNQPEPPEPPKVNPHTYEVLLKESEIRQSKILIDISDYRFPFNKNSIF